MARRDRSRRRPGDAWSDRAAVLKHMRSTDESGAAPQSLTALARATEIPPGSINAVCARLEAQGLIINAAGIRTLTSAGKNADLDQRNPPSRPHARADRATDRTPDRNARARDPSTTAEGDHNPPPHAPPPRKASAEAPGQDLPNTKQDGDSAETAPAQRRAGGSDKREIVLSAIGAYRRHRRAIEALDKLDGQTETAMVELMEQMARHAPAGPAGRAFVNALGALLESASAKRRR